MPVDVKPMAEEAEEDRDTALDSGFDEEKPTTPPPIALISSSSPLAAKIVGSHTFASRVTDRSTLNVGLAKEMEGRFMGAMAPQQFLDKHLPLKAGTQKLQRKNLKRRFDALSSAPSESAMYRPFMKALCPFAPNMVFRDTHKHPDIARDKLAPDVTLYHADDQPQETDSPTSFMRMSAFVELKKSEQADPFLDPTNSKYSPPDVCFERAEQDPAANRGQIGAYTAAILATQFRVHIFSVSICGKTARFIRWDRAGAIVSCSFNYLEDPHLLADFFWRYSHLDRCQQGYDPTLSAASEEEVKTMEDALCTDRLKDANKDHYEFRKLMVPDRDDPTDEKPFLISYPPCYESRSPFSRATRAMLAFDLTTRKMVFLKDYWRADVEGVQKEGDIYTILESKQVKNIAPFGMGNDVRDQKTLTQLSTIEPWAVPTNGIICLSHYRMTLNVVGQSLTVFESSHEFISAIADAMEAHDGAYFDARILHRDVSVGNILFTDDKKGMLIDWDLCANLNSGEVVARRPSRTGTWQFMSAMLLDRPNTPHQLEDDRESAFHVLLWIALRYTESNVHDVPLLKADLSTSVAPNTSPHEEVVNLMRAFDEAYVDGSGVVRGGVQKKSLFTTNTLSGLQFSGRPELDALVEELVETLQVRYEKPPKPSDIEALTRHEAMMAKYPDFPAMNDWTYTLNNLPAYKYRIRLSQLTARNWLVDTIRKHLATANWPDDKATAQKVVPPTGSKRKIMQDQADLEERAAKRHTSSSNHD